MALSIVWIAPDGLITSRLNVPAIAGNVITVSEAGASSLAMMAGWPPINTLDPVGIAVP